VGRLGRNLGLLEALAIGVSSMIGAGIFVLSGNAAQLAGPAVTISFGLSGLSVLLTALSFVELATAMPRAGGPYVYVREAFGETLGFLIGWSLWVGLALATAFYAIGFAQYVHVLFRSIGIPIVSVVTVLFLLAINLVGSKSAGKLQNAVVLLLLLSLAVYIAAGWNEVDRALHSPFLPYGWEPVVSTSASVFVSFLGFELIATAAEELRNPKRDLPLATISSVIGVTLLYVLVLYVATGLMPHFDLGQTRTPISDTARRSLGPIGVVVAVIGGLLATLSSANTSIMASSRIAWAMARDHLIPGFLASVHRKWSSPHAAVGVTGVIVLGALLMEDVTILAGAAGFLHLYPFLAVNLAVLKMRGRKNYQPTFRVPGGPVLPVTAAVSTLVLLTKVHLHDFAWGMVLVLPGALYYIATGRYGLSRLWADRRT